MVTVKPETGISAELPGDQDHDLPLVGELRLNLSALGVDHRVADFGERLCRLSSENPSWQFEYSAAGELIVMPPTGSDGNIGETAANAALFNWTQGNSGESYSQTVMFRLPSGAQRIPDAAWITKERFDKLTSAERRGTINGAPDFVIEIRPRSDRLPRFLAKMQEWMSGGATVGWGIDWLERRVYLYRPGLAEPEILENPDTISGEDLLPGFIFEVRRLIFDRISREEPR